MINKLGGGGLLKPLRNKYLHIPCSMEAMLGITLFIRERERQRERETDRDRENDRQTNTDKQKEEKR